MGMAFTIGMVIVFAVLAVFVAFSALFYFRPVATTVWFRRKGLRRAGFQKKQISTSIGPQTVWLGGSGPWLVMLHGAGDQAGTWHKVAPELKSRFQLLMPDFAGHGESAPRQGVLSLGTLLTALEEVLNAIPGRNTPILLAGNSLGAWMAMLYARKHPDRVKRVILIDGGPIKDVTEINLMPKDREEARRILDTVLDDSSPRPPNFFLDDLVRVSNTGPISRLMAAGNEDILKYVFVDELSSISTPVDIVWGASDRLVPLDYAKKLQSLIPHSRLAVIERCGHGPQLERPRELTHVLQKILAAESLPSSAVSLSRSRHTGANS
jgi:pimeloyl-ACP methyl ester carboxylesterase